MSNHLYHKIHETLVYQNKISNCIGMLETVMQLDAIHETFVKLMEQNDQQQIYNLTKTHNPTLQLLVRLPTINPRCGQAEKIIALLSKYLQQQLESQFSLQLDVLSSI